MTRRIFLSVMLAAFFFTSLAQNLGNIRIEKSVIDDIHIRVTQIRNGSGVAVDVTLQNDDKRMQQIHLEPGETKKCDWICVTVRAVSSDKKSSETLWSKNKTKAAWEAMQPAKAAEKTEPATQLEEKWNAEEEAAPRKGGNARHPEYRKELMPAQVLEKFMEYINRIVFLSDAELAESRALVDKYITELRNWTNTDSCIARNNLREYVRQNKDSLETYRQEAQSLIYRFSKEFDVDEATHAEISRMINDRLAQRESDLDRLQTAMGANKVDEKPDVDFDWKTAAGYGAILLVVLLVIMLIVKAGRKKGRNVRQPEPSGADSAPGIVVRRTTTSILKKQSLEDVADNPAYLQIDSSDFCADSAVRRIYLRNSCIKDIYNMYAEDLRNPSNPKEDGCMVLGRWVFDKDTDEYFVSLEHIVRPGDDAVFEEYSLNFGGKIKLRVAEKLRKLRRETNLQYDMTCWVHSHPGLGVFFSNADNSAHMQLKHPTHPLFLTAIVVDILTPEQELGIFTFKKDGTVNAKADLTKMYSLEELYKWAVESGRNTFRDEDYYNSLAKASKHYYDCVEVRLGNGAIIDMEMLASEQENGMVAFVHGFRNRQGSKTRYIAGTVSRQEAVPDNEKIGCYVTASHCSIPSIRKTVANNLKTVNFVIVASSSDGMLTTIPVLNGELCGDTNYYGEENFEELKIWTRRKR